MIFYRHERFINLLKVAIGNSMKSVMSIVKTLSAIKTRKNRIIGAFGCIKSDTFLKMARNNIHVIEIAEYNGQDKEENTLLVKKEETRADFTLKSSTFCFYTESH